jgi:hypothetical protein
MEAVKSKIVLLSNQKNFEVFSDFKLKALIDYPKVDGLYSLLSETPH